MTANISFQIEARENVVCVPVAALRFFPPPARVRPEDRRLLEGRGEGDAETPTKLSALEKAALARNRLRRLIRESFRMHRQELPAVDVLVTARAAAATAENRAVFESLERLWRAIGAPAC